MSRARDLADGTFSGTVTADDILLSDADTPTLTLTDTTNTLSTFVQSGNSTAVIGTSTNHDLRFFTNNSEKARILSGGGITFNGDTAAANALDDYEEGTWTPTVLQGSINTYSNAFYTKIGNTVHLHVGGIRLSDTTTTSAIKIYGHPFATNNRSMGSMMIRYAGTTEGYAVYFAGDYIEFFRTTNTASWVQLKHSDLTSTSCDLYLSVTYQTAA